VGPSGVERRLAAILAADVVGYSRLMEADEAGTHARLKALRKELIEPAIARHKGRVVKLTGDGALVEFPSAVGAVLAAAEIQRAVAEHEASLPSDERIAFRIGINLGDVIIESDDIYGDGVNVAARLEGLAEPGGICVARNVYNQVKGKFDCGFEYLGERTLRNIKRPVRVYRVNHGGTAGSDADAVLRLPAKPAVAVLPFTNLSGDPEQAYFSDGITEDVISELARFRELLVFARDSSFAFSGQSVSVRGVGRALGADYMVKGSVRRAGGRVRITAQLIDVTTGTHLWADRYNQPFEDLFAMEDEIVAAIAASLAGRIEAAGAEQARRKPTTDLAAYDCVLRGMKYLAEYDENANAQAREMFQRAIELDPAYARARAYLALTIYVQEVLPEAAVKEALGRALKFAREAVALDSEDSHCQRILGQIALSAREFERADFHSERATTLNPNDAHAAAFRANVLPYFGRHDEALACMSKAMRLNPLHPSWYWHMLARALHCAGRHEEAIAAYERIEVPRFFELAYLGACHAKLGRGKEARHFAERTLAAKPDFSSSTWVEGVPFRYRPDRRRLLEELLAAGLPP
jgi:adenylate cyclase